MEKGENMKRIFVVFAAIIMSFLFTVVMSASAYAADNATNYTPKYGPHYEKLANGENHYVGFVTMMEHLKDGGSNGYDIYNYGEVWNMIDGAKYDLESNTLTLEDFMHPNITIYAVEMGDDFTIKVIGNCEIKTLEVSGGVHEGAGDKGEPLYWGGSLNLIGPGSLTINSAPEENEPWGLSIWGEGSESFLKISGHVSLTVYGYGSEPAIMIVRSAGFYDNKAITIDGKALSKVYQKYTVTGFQNEAEPTLKDYWVKSSKVIIKGDGKTEIDNAPVIIEEQHLEYNGKEQAIKAVTIDGKTLKEGTDYTAAYSPASPKNVGDYTVTIKGKGKYIGTAKGSFKIIPASITDASVTGISAKAYTGKMIKQTPVITAFGLTLTSGTDYTISYNNNKKVGTAKMTIKGKGNYCDSIKKTFKIKKAANPLSIKGKTLSVEYSKVGKKNQKYDVDKVINTIKKGKGTIKYTLSAAKKDKKSFKKYFKINSKTGKVTVKKGLPEGTYKVKVKVRAAGNASYKAKTKAVTFIIKVK